MFNVQRSNCHWRMKRKAEEAHQAASIPAWVERERRVRRKRGKYALLFLVHKSCETMNGECVFWVRSFFCRFALCTISRRLKITSWRSKRVRSLACWTTVTSTGGRDSRGAVRACFPPTSSLPTWVRNPSLTSLVSHWSPAFFQPHFCFYKLPRHSCVFCRSERRSVQFNEEVQVQEMERSEPEGPVTINEDTIDRCLSLLQEADPSGELRPDNPEMALLEGKLFLRFKMFSKMLSKGSILAALCNGVASFCFRYRRMSSNDPAHRPRARGNRQVGRRSFTYQGLKFNWPWSYCYAKLNVTHNVINVRSLETSRLRERCGGCCCRKYNDLSDINAELTKALQMYHTLMREVPTTMTMTSLPPNLSSMPPGASMNPAFLPNIPQVRCPLHDVSRNNRSR